MTLLRALRLGGILTAVLFPLAACVPMVAAGGATSVGAHAAEERGLGGSISDAKIAATINHLWFQRDHIMFGKLNLEVHEGRVLLTGIVQKPEHRVDAVRLAWQAPGVRELLNEIQVSDSAGIVDIGRDIWIANELRARLMFDKAVSNINFSVEVVNGIIYVMGVAKDQQEMDRVIGHARDINHVRRVVNYILLQDDPRRQPQA